MGTVTAAAAAALATAVGAPATTAAVIACTAVALGAECVLDRDGGVFALAWPLAVTAAVTMEPGPAVVLAVSAGAAAIAVSAVLAHRLDVTRGTLATGAAVAAAVAVFAAVDGSAESAPRTVGAMAIAGIAFWVMAVAVGPRRRIRAATAVWTVPMVGAVASIGMSTTTAAPGALVAGTGAALVIVAACVGARWGSLPWRSRILGRSTVLPLVGPGALAYGASTLAVAAWVGAQVTQGQARAWWTAVVIACGDTVVAMVAVGARQWRLAPRARRWHAAVALAATAVITLVVPFAFSRHHIGSGVALGVALGVTVWCGRRSASLAASARRATAPATPVPPRLDTTERA
jgi:hypothetical protein